MDAAPAHPRVLVVDDEPLFRELVQDILEAHGMRCRTAANGVEAIQMCREAKPDLVILDMMMPLMDGVETCRRLKADPEWRAVPVIALTTSNDPAAVIKMLDAGSLMYLTKPITPDRLMAAVRFALTTPRA